MPAQPPMPLRHVAVADVLGFRALIAEHGTGWVAARFASFQEAIARLCGWEVRAQLFSDTVLLYAPPHQVLPEYEDVLPLLRQMNCTEFLGVVACAMTTSLTLDMPLRIGVAFGECAIVPDRQLFVGQAIVDAHHAEMSQDWAGIGLHPSTFDWMDAQPSDGDFWRLTEYEVPTKAGSPVPDIRWSVNWSTLGIGRDELPETLDRYLQANEGTPHEARWQRARAFFDFCVERPPEQGGLGTNG